MEVIKKGRARHFMKRVNRTEREDQLLDGYDFTNVNLQARNSATRPVNHKFTIKLSREKDGTWLARLPAFGVNLSGTTRQEAISRVQGVALRVFADRLANGKSVFGPSIISFAVVE